MSNSTQKYTYDAHIFSDLHKDAFGFRPRNHRFYEVCDSNPEEAQRIWDYVYEELEREIKRIEEKEKKDIKEFEGLIQNLINLGASNRITAIRWVIDSYDKYDTVDYICWDLGLPDSYVKEFKKVFQMEK